MAYSRSKTDKYCATCEFWTGARTPDSSYNRLSVDDRAEGMCLGTHRNQKRKQNEMCSGWKAWAVLK